MRLLILLMFAVFAMTPAALAHGVLGHVHVTGWAIENLPPGELRDFLADPEVRNAALFGAAFPDTGYPQTDPKIAAPAHAYAEHAHWEPFVTSYIDWMLVNDPPPWSEPESKRRVAFVMGCAAHGMQDEIFDSLFLDQVERHDKGGQDLADPGTDGFLALDGHLRLFPTIYVPKEPVLALMSALGDGVTWDVIEPSVALVAGTYVNGTLGPEIAKALGQEHEPKLPWTRLHYMDPAIPGSLRSEIYPTMRYLQAIWARLNGTFTPAQAITSTYPELPRRLLGPEAGSPDSWVTVVYGIGVAKGSAKATWAAQGGGAVPAQVQGTRWGAEWTRLHRIQPEASLTAGAWYDVTVAAGLALIDGTTTPDAYAIAVQVECATAGDPACPDVGLIPVGRIDGSEPEPEPAPEGEPDAGGPPTPAIPAEASGDCAAGGRSPAPLWLCILVALAIAWRRRQPPEMT